MGAGVGHDHLRSCAALAGSLRTGRSRRTMCVELNVELPRVGDAAARARHLIETAVEAPEDWPRFVDLSIVASELVNNAVIHGRGRIGLEIRGAPDGIVSICVTDE